MNELHLGKRQAPGKVLAIGRPVGFFTQGQRDEYTVLEALFQQLVLRFG